MAVTGPLSRCSNLRAILPIRGAARLSGTTGARSKKGRVLPEHISRGVARVVREQGNPSANNENSPFRIEGLAQTTTTGTPRLSWMSQSSERRITGATLTEDRRLGLPAVLGDRSNRVRAGG